VRENDEPLFVRKLAKSPRNRLTSLTLFVRRFALLFAVSKSLSLRFSYREVAIYSVAYNLLIAVTLSR